MNEVRFVDTTLRDGHASLWAERMTTGMMLPIAERLDEAGFEAIELIASSHVRKCVCELREDPWERVRLMTQRIKRTPLRLNVTRVNPFGFDPPAIYELFVKRMAANGIRQQRISDSWNDVGGWRSKVALAHAVGLQAIVNLIYSVSPRHTDEYYAERTRQAAGLGVHRLCLKDPGGLLTPERIRTLVPVVLQNAGDIPVELHSHCNTGLGPLNALEAVKHGIRIVNTGIPPLADGSALPSIFNVTHNLRALGYRPVIDEELLRPIARHLRVIAEREKFPIGAPVEYEREQYQHQIPGGMISNLAHQLRLVSKESQLQEVLEETMRVRAEFGYPIMVTPLSQFVGSQAAINVITGERYKEVTDQAIAYALGQYGREGAELMDPDVKDKILNRSRAHQLAAIERPTPSLEEIRAEFGSASLSDEELLLRSFLARDDITMMHAAGPSIPYDTSRHPLLKIVAELAQQQGCARIEMSRPGFALSLVRNAAKS